jgi:cell division protein ZapA
MADDKRTVLFSVAGKTYRVVTSASEDEIRRLAAIVDERVRAVSRGKPASPEAIVLAAIALAHEADTERSRAARLSDSARATVQRMLVRIDQALEEDPKAVAEETER